MMVQVRIPAISKTRMVSLSRLYKESGDETNENQSQLGRIERESGARVIDVG